VGNRQTAKANKEDDQHFPVAKTVGFEAYFRRHLSRHKLDFGQISANAGLGNHVESRSEHFGCGQTVGNRYRCPETSHDHDFKPPHSHHRQRNFMNSIAD
jgi:hypothetical protein